MNKRDWVSQQIEPPEKKVDSLDEKIKSVKARHRDKAEEKNRWKVREALNIRR